MRCTLQADVLMNLLSFHAIPPSFNPHLKTDIVWGDRYSQGLVHIWYRGLINEKALSRGRSEGRGGGQQHRLKPRVLFQYHPDLFCLIYSLDLPFSTPSVCFLGLQPVQSSLCSPRGLSQLMTCKQPSVRCFKKITRYQQVLKMKIFPTGPIRILLLYSNQLCRNPSFNFLIPSS